MLESLCLPAILYNQFYDVIGVNSIALAFHGISRDMLSKGTKGTTNANFLHFMFAPQSPLRISLKNQWSYFVQRNLLQFRHISLRYRYTDYYQALFDSLNQYKDFRDAWAATKGIEKAMYTQLKSYEYAHPLWGHMQYAVANSTIITQLGNLYLSTIEPCSSKTQQVLNQLSEAESSYAVPLTSWPIPELT